MKFAHLADCHIGSWRDPKLRDISTQAFIKAIDKCIQERVDFILIAGDLFNTSFPAIDKLKTAVRKFNELKEKSIPVYIVPGSHDYSPSGKTMLDVLEEAGLFINVCKGEVVNEKLRLNFTLDKKTGAKITGLLGKRGGLEKTYYENLDLEYLEKEQGFKIFIFHGAIAEYKPKELESIFSQPLSLLPKGFHYYAGGHVHYSREFREKDYPLIVYPGPLFPNSFSELEDLERGHFYIYEDGKLASHPIQILNVHKIHVKCDHKTPEWVEKEIKEQIKDKEFYNTLVLVRVDGTLESGKVSDISFRDIFQVLYDKSAYFVMKNTNGLKTKEFEEVKIEARNVEDVEEKLIQEHMGKVKLEGLTKEKEHKLIKELMDRLSVEKLEGETVRDFEKRVKEEVSKILPR